MSDIHTTSIQLRFNDVDLMGHVYNGKYQEFFDLARLNYFEKVLGKLISWTETGLVIASVKVDYLDPIYLEDQIEVQTHISSLGEKSLEMTQQLFKKGNPEPAALCTTVLVCYQMQHKKSELIPDEWRKKIKAYEPYLTQNP
ncbi:acyl-CoA thioesterase [Maribellus sp. CM-23]|uniref:acyl-CoA thioesterase n=1 Tax=Maribellus sp. CM-23 TaxID=2781026 RepID=UPI001F2CC2C6|nr:acyl-CoA thioesterase [Maribellus sp. CM-23]MCE4565970.1 acyl-CoA thioesterase [Maribellus sp. CM-23]